MSQRSDVRSRSMSRSRSLGSTSSRSRSRSSSRGSSVRFAAGRPGQKHKARNNRVYVPRKKLGFPQSLRTTLRYTTRKDLDVSSLEDVQYESFRANGMFDPEVSLGGHQPRAFDQLMGLYKTFTVLGSKISVNWVYKGYDGPASVDAGQAHLIKTISGEDAAAAVPPVMVGIHKGIEALALPLTAAEVMEHDRTSWKAMTAPEGQITQRMSCHIPSLYGKSNLVGSDGYTGDATADPTEQPHYTIWAGRMNDTAQGKCYLVAYITIEYDAVFTEPKILAAS